MPTLSDKSVYESLFGVRHRGPGRPGSETMFPGDGVPRLIADLARRRAYAVVHEEQRPRLREVYFTEVDVLKRRGLARVAADAGYELPAEEPEESGEVN